MALSLLITLLLIAASCYGEKDSKASQLALANNYLGLNLHRLLASGTSSNVFISPLSISTAFGMLYYGTTGDSAKELRDTFGYEIGDLKDDEVHSTFHEVLGNLKSANNEYVLDAANSILVDKDYALLPEYKDGVQELYKAEVKNVDFKSNSKQVVVELNKWVKDKTRGKIDSLVNELSPLTTLVLVNAVYFKGTWKTQFNKDRTSPQVFYNEGLQSETKKVPMMYLKSTFRYGKALNSNILEMPYKGDNVSMFIILPDQLDGLGNVEKELTLSNLETIFSKLKTTEVKVFFPKFKLEYKRDLSEDLKKLGTKKIFGSGADFSGITKKGGYVVDAVIHKAVVEVNEEGSEAAAVTGIVMAKSSQSGPRTPEFRVNHPFIFAIVDTRTKMILFQGRVNVL